ncbi:P-loop containing nucleoside triphosphate hydrolase protein [Amanita rubescens]|nr:P-loop containing nucleoside triphosphate hydrolase protein [Amanita rubescens]
MASFTANGLLGSAPPFLSEHHGATEPKSNEFTVEKSPGTLEDADYAEPSMQIDFKPTGLLDQDLLPEDDITFSGGLGFGLPHGLAQTSSSTEGESMGSLSTDEFTTAQTFDGKKIYLRRKTRNRGKNRDSASAKLSGAVSKLLDVPIHRLLENISVGVAAELLKAEQESSTLQNVDKDNVPDTLWVDRYRPTRFIELIGNDRIARETLTWIKQWDWCVFGKRPKAKRKATEEDDPLESLDEFRRPQQKILLLSGPPGLGKTTLAHVVSRQAGYEVMEINASDARTGSVVEDRIRPALESGSAVGKTKPVLLVIDEIDGATGAGENSSSFISKLVQLILHKPQRKRGATSARNSHAKPSVLRPIICICNDANSSALTKLRPHTYHLRYARPADAHVVNRLRYICEAECLSVESRALSTLVSTARGDFRGCLNTLQFLKARNEHVTESAVRRATNGMKEADLSISAILNDLFNPLSKKRVQELDLTEEEETRYVSRLSREIESSGRDSSVAIGCFAQYPNMRQHDANFSRYEKANECLITYDLLSAAMYSDGEFALLQYLPYTLVPFYPLFGQRGAQVERSQADWEYLQVTRANEEIYKSMSRGLRNSSANSDYRHLLTSPTLQLEFVAYINRIISPPIRPINSQIVRAEERAVLTRLVDIMISLDLRFLQERTEEGQLTYRLDPPIDVFITYDGKRAADIAVSRYAVRQLVANEIDARVSARQAGTFASSKAGNSLFAKEQATSPDNTSEPPNKRARVAEAVPVDFFGRPIIRPKNDQPKASEKMQKVRVTYRFAEGNSAAVRKPVKVEAFL